MTVKEALKYAEDTNFCAGCMIGTSGMACEDCRHRQFFETVIKVLNKDKKNKMKLDKIMSMLKELKNDN